MTPLHEEILKPKYLNYAASLCKDIEDAKEIISMLIESVYAKKDYFDKANENGYIEQYLITTIYHLFLKFKSDNKTLPLTIDIPEPEPDQYIETEMYDNKIQRDKRKKKPYFKANYSIFTSTITAANLPSWRTTAAFVPEPCSMPSRCTDRS